MTDRPEILKAVEEHGFKVFDSGADYDLNIIGARNPEQVPDIFNDRIHVCYTIGGIWVEDVFEGTTDPGLYWLKNGRQSGTAVMCHPQQIRGGYELGYHRGNIHHPCLRPVKPCLVWRDPNRDSVIDYGELKTFEAWGINIHRANSKYRSKRIHKYSAGCQVIASPVRYAYFLELLNKQIEHNNWNTFTYTLIQGNYDDS